MKNRWFFLLASVIVVIVAMVFVMNSVMAMASDKAPPVVMNQNFVSIEKSGTLTTLQNGAVIIENANVTMQRINQYQPVPGIINFANNTVLQTDQSANHFYSPPQYSENSANSIGSLNVTANSANITTMTQCRSDMVEVSNLNSEIDEKTSGAQVETPLNILRL